MKNIKNDGRRVMGCYPLYPPVELLHSMGFNPVIMWGLREHIISLTESDKHLQVYACSVARYMIEFIHLNASLLDGIVSYNACDTLRNMPEIVKCMLDGHGKSIPSFTFHVPAVSFEQSAEAGNYLGLHLNRLISAVEKEYHIKFSGDKFAESIELYRTMRNLCREIEALVSKGIIPFYIFCEAVGEGYFTSVEKHIEKLKSVVNDYTSNSKNVKNKRIILSGILNPPIGITKLFENCGLTVAGNDIAMLKRSYAFTPGIKDNPIEYYCSFYQERFPCTTILFSSDRRIDELKSLIENSGADGFVFVGEKFCEYEYFEMPFIEKKLKEWGIPGLFIEISTEDRDNLAQYKTRIEAFSEIL
ncbi:MAG: 2-hydroxyacyl-CoA dehydratase family protein [Spirochaetes bacterium]|nr:2-hydroxyacyl-CoA dehydratase family protein [Spirochaetota bacterium]